MAESCEAPDLLKIFTKIVCDKQDYCFVCLRTSDERRLVKPESFKNFLTATKVNTNGNIFFVCYMCERQASNALRMFQAAVFASSLGLILTELSKIKIKSNQNLLERRFFKKILNEVKLSKHFTPKVITEEMTRIRKNHHLSETETLVMDNKQIYEAVPTPTVVAITTHGQPQPLAGCPAPQLTQDETLGNQIPPPQETYVILDDEDDPLCLTSTSIEQKPPLNNKQNILTTATNLTSNLVITLNPPSLVTFERLLAESKTHADYILHPIFLTDSGEMNVPSVPAVIINDCLILQDSAKQSSHSHPLQINTQIVKESLKENREAFIQLCNNFPLPPRNSNLLRLALETGGRGDFPNYPQKKMKIDGAMLHDAFCEKKGVPSKSGNSSVIKEVTINDISSDMDETPKLNKCRSSKTDWEDKIPMDVISFMDAVDPNAHEVLKEVAPSGCNSMKVGNVRSLAHDKVLQTDIIDLC